MLCFAGQCVFFWVPFVASEEEFGMNGWCAWREVCRALTYRAFGLFMFISANKENR